MPESPARTGFLAALGPGLLWAGTAVGVSHLVQATRAGADHSLTLLWLVLLANLIKYPAFEAGPRYTSATGLSLLEGYRRRGRWVVALFLALTVSTMFTVLAAVTLVTAGIATSLITDALSPVAWSVLLLSAGSSLLAWGRFRGLERVMTALILLLTAATVLCVLLLLPRAAHTELHWLPLLPQPLTAPTAIFLVALVGWMPSALDIAVWQSLWVLEKERTTGRRATPAQSALDFHVGYIGTALLAALFLFLGAVVLHGSGQPIPNSGAAFASLLVRVYTEALGEGARPIILGAALATMISTTLAVLDGFPRAVEGAILRLRSAEDGLWERTALYWAAMALCVLGALLLISSFSGQLKALVDLATALTGLTAPAIALLNLLAIRGPEVPPDRRPGALYTAAHIVCIFALLGLAAAYVAVRLGAV